MIEATVTPAEEGAQEKVVINAAQDRFYAAIPGLPTTYELEKISFDLIRRSMADALKPADSSGSAEKIGAAEKD